MTTERTDHIKYHIVNLAYLSCYLLVHLVASKSSHHFYISTTDSLYLSEFVIVVDASIITDVTFPDLVIH